PWARPRPPRDDRAVGRSDALAGRVEAVSTRRTRAAGSNTAGPAGSVQAAATGGLTIERIVAVDSPREVRLHPRDRLAVFTADGGGARQLFTVSLRTGAR